MSVLWNIQDTELEDQLQAIVDNWLSQSGWQLHLYKNDYTPIPGESLGSYTEADFEGYSAGDIDMSQWGDVTIASHIAKSTNGSPITFSASEVFVGTQTVYGYYVTSAVGVLAWGERFETSRVLAASDILRVKPVFRYRNSES